MELHASKDELHHEGVAVLWDHRGASLVEVVVERGVDGREERLAEAVIGDEPLFDEPENLRLL